jgi:hypothetical protein
VSRAAALLLLLCAAPASAAEEHGLFIDLAQGVAIPVGDDDYVKFADPSYQFALRVGWELPVAERLRIAPEAALGFVAVHTDDVTFQNRGVDASFYRVRALFGPRFVVPFGVGAFFWRLGFGVDYLWGTQRLSLAGASVTEFSSTAFGFVPGLGVQFRVVRHLVLGLTVDFPIAGHDFGVNRTAFTAVDCELSALAGFRL